MHVRVSFKDELEVIGRSDSVLWNTAECDKLGEVQKIMTGEIGRKRLEKTVDVASLGIETIGVTFQQATMQREYRLLLIKGVAIPGTTFELYSRIHESNVSGSATVSTPTFPNRTYQR